MPVTKSAKKALRKDRRRTVFNKRLKEQLKKTIKNVRKNPSLKTLKEAFRFLDRAVKKKFIHKNKAARLKSRLSKLLAKNPKPIKEKPQKKISRKVSKKVK